MSKTNLTRILIILLIIVTPFLLLCLVIVLDKLHPDYNDFTYYLCEAAYSVRCFDRLNWTEDQIRARFQRDRQTGASTKDDFKRLRTLSGLILKDEWEKKEELMQKDFLSEEESQRLDRAQKTIIYTERALKVLDELGV